MSSPAAAPPTGHPDLERFLAHLVASGVAFRVAADLRHDPDQGGHPHAPDAPRQAVAIPGLPLLSEHRDGRIGSDHATWSVATDMATRGLVAPGSTFWDVGTGSGVLALAAHLLGAGSIVATDVCVDALRTAHVNVEAAGAPVRLVAGSLLHALPPDEPAADLVAANLPHKPGRDSGTLPLAEDGGPDGDALLLPFFDQVEERLPSGASVLFFQHSLPHPRNLVRLRDRFDLTLLSWKRRFLGADEYGPLQEWFAERSRAGTSYLAETEGSRFLIACVWLATRR